MVKNIIVFCLLILKVVECLRWQKKSMFFCAHVGHLVLCSSSFFCHYNTQQVQYWWIILLLIHSYALSIIIKDYLTESEDMDYCVICSSVVLLDGKMTTKGNAIIYPLQNYSWSITYSLLLLNCLLSLNSFLVLITVPSVSEYLKTKKSWSWL